MVSAELPPHVEVMKFILGKWISKPIYVAAKLNIPDMVSGGPKTIEELAQKTNAHAPSLYRIMRALSCLGIFCELDDGRFELTSMAECIKQMHVLHDWNDEECLTILKNLYMAMNPGAKLLVVEAIIPKGNEFSIAKLLDLEVFVMGGGRERTDGEFLELFESAGFELSRVIPTDESISVIEAVRKA